MYDINEVVSGYIEAIKFTEEINDSQQFHDENVVMENITEQCKDFIEKIKEFIPQMEECNLQDRRVGHCFWYDRNGHGTGFWDEDCIMVQLKGDNKMLSDILAEVAKSFGEIHVVKDEKLVYLLS